MPHLGSSTPTISFNEHNAAARLPALLGRLAAGETLALTTDAGMPGVSDPGGRLVAAARSAGAAVEVVPGPTAVTTAMALAGVDAAGFIFGGFLPSRPASVRAGALARLLNAAGSLGLPLILYEAPHRVRALLAALSEAVPDARVAIGRELTKRHEEVLVGAAAEVNGQLGEPRGEFTLVISGLAAPAADQDGSADALLEAGRRAGLADRTLVELLRAVGVSRRDAYGRVAGKPSLSDR